MREVQASEARTHFHRLLKEVEGGETLVITRSGRPIARLLSETAVRQKERSEAIARIAARRQRIGTITVEEILSARDEGRR